MQGQHRVPRHVGTTENHHRSFRRFGRTFSWLATPFLDIDLPPPEQRPIDTPVIWAPNHRSMFDTFLGLIGLHRMDYTAGFLVTERYFESRVTGALLERIGAMRVDPSVDGGRRIITDGVARLDAGDNLVIMAEGRLVPSHERTNGIGPLEPGVTVLAKRAGVPIQPVAMVGTDELLPVGSTFPRVGMRRRRLVVRFGQPIPPEGRSRQLLDALTEQLSELVVSTEALFDTD
jgi:1-acyl-sn-glycerol-3-phosphate acyltransferase